MNIQLTHPFLLRCKSTKSSKISKGVEELLNNCFKFGTFASRLERQAIGCATDGAGEIDEDKMNKYKGDGFELFVEAFVRVFGADMLIGIDPHSYQIEDTNDDYGIDATGIGLNGKIHTVQIKYRQAIYILTANNDHLTNFKSLSVTSVESGGKGVDPNDKFITKRGRARIKDTCNMTIIHCGKEIHYEVKENMLQDVREIKRSDIVNKVDDNGIFWDSFRESWSKSIERKIQEDEKEE